MLVAKDISKSFGSLKVLKSLSLYVKKGEIISIVGASGAGKSTLLHILGTIDKADSGIIKIDDIDVGSLQDKQLSRLRNLKTGFVFQFHHLLHEFTALENICIPAYIAGKSQKQAEKMARKLLKMMDLSERESHKPNALSGGEQQRVAMARALINEPAVIFADEPSGNLDSEASAKLHNLIFDLRNELDQTFVIVTHNDDLANMADRKLKLIDGRF